MDTTNLKKSYGKLNEGLIKQFDDAGVRRSFTVPYIDGQSMSDHITAVGQAASQSGGMTNNMVVSAHHSTGKGWGSGDGHTVGHPSDKLRSTIVPEKDENAKKTIDAAQAHLNAAKKLLGDDDKALTTAQSQLNLVKKTDGAGMNLLDFGVFMTQIMWPVHQALARAHSGTKKGGHAPQLRGPEDQNGSESTQQPQGEGQGAPKASTDQSAAQASPAAPEAQAAPAGATPQQA